MKKFLCILSAVSFIAVSTATAQVKEDFVPSPNNQPGKEYPQVNSERRVRVRIQAPEAKSVKLDIGGTKYDLEKGKDGFWMGDSAPLDEGFHYYQIDIDGASVPDPSSLYYYGCDRWGSGIDVPATDESFYALRKESARGRIREINYWSKTKNAMAHCFVYTPAAYDKDDGTRYPVLYIQHGGGENEYSWAQQGKTDRIMDNLIAAGKAVPFIVVMGKADFDDSIVNDLVPEIDTRFRTIPDNAHRAMAGLSMGGLLTKTVCLAHPEIFSSVGIFSGGTITSKEADETPGFRESNKIVFVSFGSHELEHRVPGFGDGTDPEEETRDLKASGANAYFYVSPGTAHEWLSWRRSLYQFAQLLFR